jgi:dipeptidyl aminopeptidase/acylaminoacyl peptidase
VTGASGLFDVGDNLHVSSKVLGVGSVAGPIDLLNLASHEFLAPLLFDLFGALPSTRRDLAQSANPINHIDKETPPFVIIHGDRDDAVPCQQAELLHAALNSKGIPSRLVIQAGIGHDNWKDPQMVGELIRFFDCLLK